MAKGHPLQVLSEWVALDDGMSLYQRLTRDIQDSRTTEQLALTLAASLCHRRLLYSSNDTAQPTKGNYLADFDALIKGEPLSNEQTVFRRMLFSFLQVLETPIDRYQNISNFLTAMLHTATPILDPFDEFSDQYWVYRM